MFDEACGDICRIGLTGSIDTFESVPDPVGVVFGLKNPLRLCCPFEDAVVAEEVLPLARFEPLPAGASDALRFAAGLLAGLATLVATDVWEATANGLSATGGAEGGGGVISLGIVGAGVGVVSISPSAVDTSRVVDCESEGFLVNISLILLLLSNSGSNLPENTGTSRVLYSLSLLPSTKYPEGLIISSKAVGPSRTSTSSFITA